MSSLRWAILILGALVLVAIYLHGRYRSGSRGAEDGAGGPDRLERREPGVDASFLSELADDVDQEPVVPVLRDIPPYQQQSDRGDEPLIESNSPLEPARRDEGQAHAPGTVEAPEPPEATAPGGSEARSPIGGEADLQGEAVEGGGESAGGPAKLIILYVIAEEGGFEGEDIHRVLQRLGLVLAADGVFKRYIGLDRAAGASFQVASAVEPGVFEQEKLAETRTPGLVMFATLPGPKPASQALAEMLEAARSVAASLGGSILDEARQPLTEERCRALADEMTAFDAEVARNRS